MMSPMGDGSASLDDAVPPRWCGILPLSPGADSLLRRGEEVSITTRPQYSIRDARLVVPGGRDWTLLEATVGCRAVISQPLRVELAPLLVGDVEASAAVQLSVRFDGETPTARFFGFLLGEEPGARYRMPGPHRRPWDHAGPGLPGIAYGRDYAEVLRRTYRRGELFPPHSSAPADDEFSALVVNCRVPDGSVVASLALSDLVLVRHIALADQRSWAVHEVRLDRYPLAVQDGDLPALALGIAPERELLLGAARREILLRATYVGSGREPDLQAEASLLRVSREVS